MGVIKPPWISQEWFRQTPFNYCDHFGNQKRLAEVCKICKEEMEFKARCKREGKDPYHMKVVFKEIGDNLAKTLEMVHEEAKRMGIDLKNIDEDYQEPPPSSKYRIFKLVSIYGNRVEKVIRDLSEVPVDANIELIMKTVDVFSHSRHYILAKIGRALSSRWYEKQDPEDLTYDSKTSALLAYIAIERNSRAAFALAKEKTLEYSKQKHLKLAKLSIELTGIIKQQFLPKDKLAYREFGCEEYDELFEISHNTLWVR